MLGHGALGEFALAESGEVLSFVEARARREGGGTGLIFPTAGQLEEIRERAREADAARERSRRAREEAQRAFRAEIEKNYLISIGAWVEPFTWPDIPHPEADLSALAFEIGGQTLQDKFDALIWQVHYAERQALIDAEEEEVALLVAAA